MVKAFSEFNGGVTFGNVNVGVNAASVPIKIDRGVINLNMAEQLFCGHRLIGRIVLGTLDEANNTSETQTKLIDDVDHEVSGAFDVKRFSCSKKQIGITASFSLEDIEIGDLAKFANGSGRLIVSEIGEIPEPEKPEKPVTAHLSNGAKADGPWRKVKLDTIFDPEKQIRKAMAEKDVHTVGDFSDWQSSGKKLTDFPGIGPGKAQEIEDSMLLFWKNNPQYAEAT
jgi:hypothetical protein